MGTLDLKLTVVRPLVEIYMLPDIHRETSIPMLQYIKDVLNDLQVIEKLTQGKHPDQYVRIKSSALA